MNDMTEAHRLQNVGQLDRSTYLGSSDAAAILGLSDWGTPLSVYLEKIGQPEPLSQEKLDFFEDRKELEPIVVSRMVRRRNAHVIAQNHRYRHPDHPFLAAEIDFEFEVTPAIVEACPGIPKELIGTIQNGEAKTNDPFSNAPFGEEGTSEIPIQYCCQSMHGLMVTGRQICLYAVMTGMDSLSTYVYYRDEEDIANLLEKELYFMNEYVLKRRPPEPINNDDLKRLFSKYRGRPVDLDDATYKVIKEIKELNQHGKDIEEKTKELKFQVGLYVAKQWGLFTPEAAEDNAVLNYIGKKVATWNMQSRSGIDSKALAKEYPDIAKQFQKTSHFRVLR